MTRPARSRTQRRYDAAMKIKARRELQRAISDARLQPGPMNGCDLDGGCDACQAGVHDPIYRADGDWLVCRCRCCGDVLTEEGFPELALA